MHDLRHVAVTLALGLPAVVSADTFVPVEQDRFVSATLQTECGGVTSDDDVAVLFETFDSTVGVFQDCPGEPTLAGATAIQTSSIGGSAMSVVAAAVYNVQSPGTVVVSGVSNFSVTFELPRTSLISFEGVLLGSGPSGGVQAFLRLTGSQGLIVDRTLTGPFPFGEPTMLFIGETHVLEPGVYTVHGRAHAIDAIDIARPIFVAEADLNATIDVTILGDTDGDEVVDVSDLINVILCWGTTGIDCPAPGVDADVNRDGIVDVLDLVAVILAFGG